MFVLLLLLAGLSFGLSLEEAMRTALEKSPVLKAMEERLRIFEGMERSASAFPNPHIGFESGFLATDKKGGASGRAVYLRIREKSRKVVEEERESFQKAFEARKREILAEVYRSFYTALVRKEVVEVWRESVRTAEEVEAFVKKAYELGEVTELKPTLSAGFVIEDSEEGYYGLRFSLSTTFPVFYRRQGEILQGIARREALRRELEAELLRLRTKLSSIKVRMETLRKEIERLEREIIPRAKEELDLALRSYRLRVITLLELSDVRRRYYELLVSRAELLGNLHRIYAEFIEIGGWR